MPATGQTRSRLPFDTRVFDVDVAVAGEESVLIVLHVEHVEEDAEVGGWRRVPFRR